MAVGMVLGALTTLNSSTGYLLAWVALAGLGIGLVVPNAMAAALSDLSADRSGAGSALLTAMRQVGTTIGVAVLGTVISTSYASHLAGTAAGLSAPVAASVRSSVGAGVAAAQHIGSASLLGEIRTAFVNGMDLMLWICCGIAVGCALLAAVVLRPRPKDGPPGAPDELAGAVSGGEGAQSAP
jgi:DHA2 family multidrug resistance protein-like MFS transporter